jgi:integrase
MPGVLELAVRAKRLPANPAARVELPHSRSRRNRYPTADQVELMAEAARALAPTRPRPAPNASLDQHRQVVYVLAYCGLRWSEVAALRTHSLDLVKGRITVQASVVESRPHRPVWGAPKSHEARWVPIPKFLLNVYCLPRPRVRSYAIEIRVKRGLITRL